MSEGKDKLLEITLYSGMLAGILGKTICHPIDTIRAKIQVFKKTIIYRSDKPKFLKFKQNI